MKILVCMSVVPDTTTKITFTDNNTSFNTDGVQFIINPYDELALTKALELTEANGGSVTVIHVGLASSEPVIRKALAIGAQEAIRVDSVAHDGMFVAQEISHIAKDGEYDLILTGRESIDYNGGQVAAAIAAVLDVPLMNVVSDFSIDGSTVIAKRDIDGGKEELKASLPCVISAQKDLCEARIPNMRGIMQARTKPLNVVSSQGASQDTSFNSYELPEAKSGVQMIDADNAEELIDLLHNQKKLF
ncbi:MAG: electron transfer flavoprotein subunit beta/FixA family protein [Bacteroidia bacterium]